MTKKHNSGFLRLVEAAKAKIQEIGVEEVMNLMEENTPMIILDTREESEWASGHISGAIHMGKGVIERDIEKRIPDHHCHLVLYCGGGFRSALAADALQQMGYTRVASMAGGWRRWNALGGAVE